MRPEIELQETPTGPPRVHATAVVDPDAQLAPGVTIGPFSVIGKGVQIGEGTQIESHVCIATGTTIGRHNRIFHGAILGTAPQDLKYDNEPTILQIGDRNTIREYSTIHRGTTRRGITRVGNDCFLMAYSHVAHDAELGDHVVLANVVNLAGHVTIEDWVVIGGLVPIHQFVRIGCHSMVGGGFRLSQDVCPYALTGGYPLKVVAPNVIGLKRRGFTQAQIVPIKRAFRLLFKSGRNTTQALLAVEGEVEQTAEVIRLVGFIRNSERGVVK